MGIMSRHVSKGRSKDFFGTNVIQYPPRGYHERSCFRVTPSVYASARSFSLSWRASNWASNALLVACQWGKNSAPLDWSCSAFHHVGYRTQFPAANSPKYNWQWAKAKMWCGRTARVQCMWFRRSQLQIHRLNWTRQFLQNLDWWPSPASALSAASFFCCSVKVALISACNPVRYGVVKPCWGYQNLTLTQKYWKHTTGSHGQSIHFIHHPTLTWSPKKCHQKHGCVDFHNGNQIDLSCFGH